MSLPNDPIEIQLRSSLSDGSPIAADEAKWQMIEGRIVHADSRRRGMIAGGATMAMVMAIAGAIVISGQAGSGVRPTASSSTGVASMTALSTERGLTNATLALAGSGITQTNGLTKLRPTILPPGYVYTEAHASLADNYPQSASPTDRSQYFADPTRPPESTPVLAVSVLPQRNLDLVGDTVTLKEGEGRLAQSGSTTRLQMLRNNGTFVVNLIANNIESAIIKKIADAVSVSTTATGPTIELPGGLMPSLNLISNTAITEQRQLKDSWSLIYTNPAAPGSNFGVSATAGTATDLEAQILIARIFDDSATVVNLATLNGQQWPADQPAYLVSIANIGSSNFGLPSKQLSFARHGLVIKMWLSDTSVKDSALIESAASLAVISEPEWESITAQPTNTTTNDLVDIKPVVSSGSRGSTSYEISAVVSPAATVLGCKGLRTKVVIQTGDSWSNGCSNASLTNGQAIADVQTMPIKGAGLLVYGFVHSSITTVSIVPDVGAPISVSVAANVIPNTDVKPFSLLLPDNAHWADVSASSSDGSRASTERHHGKKYQFPTVKSVEAFQKGKIITIASGKFDGRDWILGYAPVATIDGSTIDCHRLELGGQAIWDDCYTQEIPNADPLAYLTASVDNGGFVVGTAADWVQRIDLRDLNNKTVGSTKVTHTRPTRAFAIPVAPGSNYTLHAIDSNGVDSGPMGINGIANSIEVTAGQPFATTTIQASVVSTATGPVVIAPSTRVG